MTGRRRVPRGVLAVLLLAMLVVLAVARVARPAAPSGSGAGPAPVVLTPQATGSRAPVEQPVPRVVPDLSARELRRIQFADVTAGAGLSQPARELGGGDDFPGMTAGLALTHWPNETSQGRALLSTSQYDPVRFWVLRNGRFVDRTDAVGLGAAGRGTAAGFADLDADGDVDLVLGRQQDAVLSVWRNKAGVLHDATAAFGIDPRSTAPPATGATPLMRGIAFADVNLDGRLDFLATDWNPSQLVVSASGLEPDKGIDPDVMACKRQAVARKQPRMRISQTRLYLASASGTFTDATVRWRLDPDPVAAFSPQFVNLNDDQWPDLLIAGDLCSSRVMLNDHGRGFTDITGQTRADQTPFGMGAAITDLNGDERPDWLVTGISYPTATGACPALYVIDGCSGNRAFTGLGGGIFRDATDSTGLRDSGWAWGVAVEDFANTGERQVAIANGYASSGAYYEHFADDPISFFVRHHGKYVDVAPLVGLKDTSVGHALLPLDYDGDGRLDLLMNSSDSGLKLWRNTTPQTGRHWVRIALEDPTSSGNVRAWGARVRVTSASGAVTNCWITSSTSYETSWPGECHVGLGGSSGPVRVEVWWPGASMPTTYAGVATDRVTLLRRS